MTQLVITRLIDPDPQTGNRMMLANVWQQRPKEMKQERAFLRDSADTSIWHVITDITPCGEHAYHFHFGGTHDPVHVEMDKAIYITEDQHERFIEFHRKKISANVMLQDMPEKQKANALAFVKRVTDLNRTMPDQLELVEIDGSLKDIQVSAWGVVDKQGKRQTWLPITEADPWESANPQEQILLADKANPEGAPHRYKVYYS